MSRQAVIVLKLEIMVSFGVRAGGGGHSPFVGTVQPTPSLRAELLHRLGRLLCTYYTLKSPPFNYSSPKKERLLRSVQCNGINWEILHLCHPLKTS